MTPKFNEKSSTWGSEVLLCHLPVSCCQTQICTLCTEHAMQSCSHAATQPCSHTALINALQKNASTQFPDDCALGTVVFSLTISFLPLRKHNDLILKPNLLISSYRHSPAFWYQFEIFLDCTVLECLFVILKKKSLYILMPGASQTSHSTDVGLELGQNFHQFLNGPRQTFDIYATWHSQH